eukprot:g34058.t1
MFIKIENTCLRRQSSSFFNTKKRRGNCDRTSPDPSPLHSSFSVCYKSERGSFTTKTLVSQGGLQRLYESALRTQVLQIAKTSKCWTQRGVQKKQASARKDCKDFQVLDTEELTVTVDDINDIMNLNLPDKSRNFATLQYGGAYFF